ncbi:MAG TPA: PIN domain-containing protein [Bryobacteraceae bacterium]|jgi:hypothetical protein|nr:PIN domain-containing protein [Bryobacteraceae bacterium]
MPGKALVIDANILVRAVLGRRVREIIERYAEQALFFVPAAAYFEAEEHVPALVVRRGGDPAEAVAFLGSLRGLVELIGSEVYGDFEDTARERIGERETGLYWRQHWQSAVQFGRKTPISSGAAYQRDDEPGGGVFA